MRTTRHTDYRRVDFAAHAASLGAAAEKVERLEDLPGAWRRAKASDRSYAIVMDIHQYSWTEGGAWWEVGIPEVSDRADVLVARAAWEAEKKHQRVGV